MSNRIESDSIIPDLPYRTSTLTSRIDKNKLDKRYLTNITMLSAQQIETDLVEQIRESQQLCRTIKLTLPEFNNIPISIQELRIMEESILRKNILIREVEEQIKMIKNGTYFNSKKTVQNEAKLGDEIKSKREMLNKNKVIFEQKQTIYDKKYKTMKILQEQFRQKCEKQEIEFLTFEEFKQNEMKKKKDQKRFRKMQKKTSIKDLNFNTSKNQIGSSVDGKKMKEYLQKKNVAEMALKTSKKKHGLQLNDLFGKLEFLRDENQQLSEKVALKEQELRDVENKFSKSRTITDPNVLLKRIHQQRKF